MYSTIKRIKNKLFSIFYPVSPITIENSNKMNWHEDFIVELAKVVKPQVYIELGLYQCTLFNRILPYADKLIGVDIEKSAGEYMKNSSKTEFFNLSTDEFIEYIKISPIQIDMLFIDADHSKEAVFKDFKNFFPFVRPHGLILLHDTHPENEYFKAKGYCGDGFKAIECLSNSTTDYEMVTIPVHPGLTICRKRNSQLSYE
jgi:predicted O-methyltransferase YrrM